MANKKFTELPAATTPLDGTERAAIVQGGASKNTLLSDMPVSTPVTTALGAKAPLASPALTGNPTAPTPSPGDNDTSVSTTAFVAAAITAHAGATDPHGDRAYADTLIAAADAMVFKTVIDASTNPNYPAADKGWTYRIGVAGKIGGASGVNVEQGDIAICLADGTSAGTQAAVGGSWSIIQTNIDGAVIGPASAVNGNLPVFSGTGGKLLADSGVLAASLAPIVESVNAVATAGAAQTLPDVTAATLHRLTLTAATCTLTFPAAAAGKSFSVVLAQDATGSRLVTWPTVLWAGGVTPTLTTTASKRDVFTFLCADGTNWLGFIAGQNH